jgi:glycosyltransferase involved in cell wall biosynthesis
VAARPARRVLIALPQTPLDPASGAARTACTIGEMLARTGVEVRCVSTTASEAATPIHVTQLVDAVGAMPVRTETVGTARRRVVRFQYRGIDHALLDIGGESPWSWQSSFGTEFDLLFDDVFSDFSPHVLLTYGGSQADRRRHHRARAAGCRVVLAVFTTDYLAPVFFEQVDAVLTPSSFISALYRERLGIDSVALPSPVDLDDVIAPHRHPSFVTMINPSIEKGVMFFARLAHELATRDPHVPIMVVESRGSRNLLLQAGLVGGFDLRQHDNLSIRPMYTHPRDIYAQTRMILVPSVIEEASGRVVAEALLNGIPALVSDRGGLPENCGEGGLVLPLDERLTLRTRRPVRAEVVEPWLREVLRLVHNEASYRAASRRALRASVRFDPDTVSGQYCDFFASVAAMPRPFPRTKSAASAKSRRRGLRLPYPAPRRRVPIPRPGRHLIEGARERAGDLDGGSDRGRCLPHG